MIIEWLDKIVVLVFGMFCLLIAFGVVAYVIQGIGRCLRAYSHPLPEDLRCRCGHSWADHGPVENGAEDVYDMVCSRCTCTSFWRSP